MKDSIRDMKRLDQSQPLRGLVEYQPDAIVSKVLAKTQGGNVTLSLFEGRSDPFTYQLRS